MTSKVYMVALTWAQITAVSDAIDKELDGHIVGHRRYVRSLAAAQQKLRGSWSKPEVKKAIRKKKSPSKRRQDAAYSVIYDHIRSRTCGICLGDGYLIDDESNRHSCGRCNGTGKR